MLETYRALKASRRIGNRSGLHATVHLTEDGKRTKCGRDCRDWEKEPRQAGYPANPCSRCFP